MKNMSLFVPSILPLVCGCCPLSTEVVTPRTSAWASRMNSRKAPLYPRARMISFQAKKMLILRVQSKSSIFHPYTPTYKTLYGFVGREFEVSTPTAQYPRVRQVRLSQGFMRQLPSCPTEYTQFESTYFGLFGQTFSDIDFCGTI